MLVRKGNAARGIDFPDLEVDLKVTSTKRPQSSSPFRDATQKVYGLGYHLLVLIYSKEDDNELGKAWVTFHHAIFVDRNRTADSRTTPGLRDPGPKRQQR